MGSELVCAYVNVFLRDKVMDSKAHKFTRIISDKYLLLAVLCRTHFKYFKISPVCEKNVNKVPFSKFRSKVCLCCVDVCSQKLFDMQDEQFMDKDFNACGI